MAFVDSDRRPTEPLSFGPRSGVRASGAGRSATGRVPVGGAGGERPWWEQPSYYPPSGYPSSTSPRRRPPRRVRLWPLFVVLGVVLVGMAGCGILGLTALFGERTPPIQIPEDVPPAAGAPLPAIDVDAVGRTADQLSAWAGDLAGATDIPQTALEAYGYAAAVMAARSPECGIAWTTLAGIGSVESDHGRHGGAEVGANGDVTPEIRGLPLDGQGGRAEIRDTDGGELDGDTELDRAMGPMQFIPQTWQQWGVDANGDGRADPDNIDDAALTAARYLCARGGTLTTPEGWSSALYAYNLAGPYQLDVRDRAAAYALGIEPR